MGMPNGDPQGGYGYPPHPKGMNGMPYGAAHHPNTPSQGYANGYGAGWQGGGMPPQPPQPPKKKQSGGKGVVVLVVLAILLLAVGGVVLGQRIHEDNQVKAYVEPYNTRFCENVYVDGIHLGGMTWEEGRAAVYEKASSRNESWYVNLTYMNQVVYQFTATDINLTVDVDDALLAAWALGHDTAMDHHQRKAAMEALLTTPYYGYSAQPAGDTSRVDLILDQLANEVYSAPTDARLLTFDPSLSDPFQFQEEVPGRRLDTTGLKTSLYQMVSSMESGDVEIVPQTIEPTITVADLRKGLSLRASVYTPISKDSTESRTNNIRRCFQLVSGYILQPGQKFSFNSVVGKRTLKNGFYEAIEYAYGEETMGVGGGVCQASTTLYQAAVNAGLEIVHREPHSDSVSYAAYGEDATVYWEGNRKIDLVFRNNTDGPLYLVAAVESDPKNRKRFIAKVSIYGQEMEEGVRYELTSQTVEVLQPPVEPVYVKDKNQTYVTYTDQKHRVRKAKEGYVVESYRLKYEGDTVVERTLLYTDRYEAKAEKYYVGVKERESK